MRVYCQRHHTLLTPEPSGYGPTASWHCPTEPDEQINVYHMMAVGIAAHHPDLACVVVVPGRTTTRLVAFPK